MTEEQAEQLDYNPFDLTKVWFYKDFPLIDVGIVELNRNPDNYFADIEQVALAPSNIVSGISFSPDKMLQARIFAYADAQRYRLGANHQHLPVNRPRNEISNHQRAGQMRFDGNGGSELNYEPNSFGGAKEDKSFAEPPLKISGDAARYDHRKGNDDYSQAGKLFNVMSAEQQEILCGNIANAMHGVPQFIMDRQLEHFDKADPKYGAGVRQMLQKRSAINDETGDANRDTQAA
jgi:catalase